MKRALTCPAIAAVLLLSACTAAPDSNVERAKFEAAKSSNNRNRAILAFAELEQQAVQLLGVRDLPQAKEVSQRALSLGEGLYGHEDARLAKTLTVLIASSCAQGQCTNLETQWQQLFAINEKSLGADAPQTLMTLWQLGEVYEKQKQYARAAQIYQAVLSSRKKQNSPLVGASLIALARVARAQKDDQAAIAYLRQAEQFERTNKGAHASLLPMVLRQLAEIKQAAAANR